VWQLGCSARATAATHMVVPNANQYGESGLDSPCPNDASDAFTFSPQMLLFDSALV
jgi:hypothetical protein